MPRLSVSLDSDQEAWIVDMAQDLGVSKGKVIRECIEEIRTGDSLLTRSVNTDESADSDRYQELEQRLESLEEAIRMSTVSPPDPSLTTGQSRRNESKPDSGPPRKTTGGSEQVPEGKQASDEASTPEDSASDGRDSFTLPGSVLGDVPSEAPAESPGESDTEASGSSDSIDAEPSTRPSSRTSDRPSSLSPSDTEFSDTAETASSTLDTQSDSESPPDHPESAPEPSPDRTSRPAADRAPSPVDSTSRQESTSTSAEEAGDDEIQKVDVDKSDPDAVQTYLQSTLEKGDHATAVFACWKRLRDRGTLHTRAMQSLHEDYPLGFEDAREWWSDAIEPELVKIPGVQPPEGGGKLYRFSY